MSRLDAWPARAQLRPGEPLELVVETDAPGELEVRVSDEGTTVAATVLAPDEPGRRLARVDLPPDRARAGYGIHVATPSGDASTSAIDVAPHWSAAPRYGAFAEFGPGETAHASTRRADELLRLHVNVVQFYDWMASHHTFRSSTDEFVDPLGRRLSHVVVRRKVRLAHERGMAALAYGAIYGAEEEFSRARPDWLLYDGRREPLALADIFYLQDFSAASAWRGWILDQYRDALVHLGFDGIHIDQYGYPKHALSRATGDWRDVDVAAEFPGFVEEAARRILAARPEGGAIFNCVNAWPLEGLRDVTSDAATYIEVWEPHTRYRDLYELIRRARVLRPGKAVILAAYLLPFHPDRPRSAGALTAFRLASATIAAAGGHHLIAVEGSAFLAEAYYPRHGRLDEDETLVARRYADFIVRNTTRLHDLGSTDIAWTHVGPTNDAITMTAPGLERYGAGAEAGSLWVVGREAGSLTVIQLVNLRGVIDAWNAEQPTAPTPIEGLEIRVRVTGDVEGVWWDTPDDAVGAARPLPFEVVETSAGRFLVLSLPRVDVWSSVWWRVMPPGRLP